MEEFFNKKRAIGLLNILNERERQIIDLRYGLKDGETHTLAQVAKLIGVSRERVRQIEVATIKKIRQTLEQREEGRL